MKNVTKLSIWPYLKRLGFKPVRFKAHGRVQSIGAALYYRTGGDRVVIEPHYFRSGPNYSIYGGALNFPPIAWTDAPGIKREINRALRTERKRYNPSRRRRGRR